MLNKTPTSTSRGHGLTVFQRQLEVRAIPVWKLRSICIGTGPGWWSSVALWCCHQDRRTKLEAPVGAVRINSVAFYAAIRSRDLALSATPQIQHKLATQSSSVSSKKIRTPISLLFGRLVYFFG